LVYFIYIIAIANIAKRNAPIQSHDLFNLKRRTSRLILSLVMILFIELNLFKLKYYKIVVKINNERFRPDTMAPHN
jgi:hypothetical protein